HETSSFVGRCFVFCFLLSRESFILSLFSQSDYDLFGCKRIPRVRHGQTLTRVQQIKSAFYSLSKVFSESKIVEYSVQENFISPGKREILIDNKQHYKFLGKDIDVISLIKLYLADGKVVRHEDWWNKKPLLSRETAKLPLVGQLVEMTRRGSMLVTHAMMRFGKDPTV
ncbi:hypothetical protein I3760_14G036500, partial [Carya illinoinensis]